MKRFLRILSIALLAVLLSVGCLAESSPFSVMEWSVLEDGSLRILFYLPDSDVRNATLMLDDKEVTIDSLQKEDPSEEGSSWIFLVDTASVSTNSGTEPISKLMPELIKLVGKNDNGTVITNGENYDDTYDGLKLSTLQSTLNKQIKELSGNKENTGLYQTVAAAVNFLGYDESAKAQRNLVIISQGTTSDKDDPDIGDIRQVIEDTGVCVYCIAFPPKGTSDADLEDYCSLAESSRGGKVFAFTPDEYKNDEGKENLVSEVIEGISENEISHYVLSASPAAEGISGSELMLEVERKDGVVVVVREYHTLNSEEQQRILDNIPAVIEPTLEPTPEPTPTVNPYPISFVPLKLQELLIVGVCILLAVGIVVIAVVLSRKKSYDDDYGHSVPISGAPNDSAGGPPSEPGGAPAASNVIPASGVVSPVYPADNNWTLPPQQGTTYRPDAPVGTVSAASLNVTLTQVGDRQGVYSAQMNDHMFIGRDPARAQLVLPGDDLKISGSHLILRYRNGALYAEDISRNGTLLNDMRLHQPTMLHQQDVLTLGNSRFRITWSMR